MAGRRNDAVPLRVELAELEDGTPPPPLTVFAVDAAGAVLGKATVDREGRAALPESTLKKAAQILVGSPSEAANGARFHAAQVLELVDQGLPLELGPWDWMPLLPLRTCIEGSVRKCRFPFLWLREALLDASAVRAVSHSPDLRAAVPGTRLASLLDDAIIARPLLPPFLRRCTPICDGVVEVYRRRCCCHPPVLDDARLDDLLDRLDDLLERWPPFPIPWPPEPDPPFGPIPGPGPGPDPVPDVPFDVFAGGTLSPLVLRAQRDAVTLRSLPAVERPRYVLDRPYLRPFWCSCGPPARVGQGSIRPDGRFRVCWLGLPFTPVNCHDEYAFVVTQVAGGSAVTIYDGLAAHEWFRRDDDIVLTTYDRRAVACRDNPFPGETGAFVVLEDIGSTPSHRLKSPAQDAWDGVLAPGYNDGLANPAPTPAAAAGALLDQNWGGTLALQLHFSESMRNAPVGARYYRISVVTANANGDPTGPRTPLGGALSWLYYDTSGGSPTVQAQALGPATVGGEANLYTIPFDADRDWQSGQYHGYLDTTAFADGRHLVTIEVFDGAGQKLRPAGAPGPGADRPFTNRRWATPTGPLQNVPFASLTHMFWWDNRKAVGTIVDLRRNGVPSTGECQFLVGRASATFSAGYRAYHPHPMFILNHVLWWRRGLGGPSGTLIDSPANAGQPPAPVAATPTTSPPASPAPSFANLLGPHRKCSFTLNLHVNVKTTNGSGLLEYLDATDQAAFALERT